MRLGSCIAVELLVGASILTALGVGSAWGVGELQEYLEQAPASAEARTPAPRTPGTVVVAVPGRGAGPASPAGELAMRAAIGPAEPGPLDSAGVVDADPGLGDDLEPYDLSDDLDDEGEDGDDDRALAHAAVPPGVPAWHQGGQTDAAALAPLRVGNVVKVKFNRGGSSLSLRLDFDNGARAAFKPEQVHPQSNPRREIAAYRIDRLLGLDRVPPAVGRSFAFDDLAAAVPPSDRFKIKRLRDEAVARKGVLRGELSWWIPVIVDGKVSGFPIDDTDGIVTWRRLLRPGTIIPEGDAALVRQISDMIVFDFLIDNTDRWSGNNAKVSEDGRLLYFMDNTMAFTRNVKGHRKSHTYLGRVQTFSRRLIGAIRGLTEAQIRAAVADDAEPFGELLTDAEISALLRRRDKLMAYVDGLIAEHGDVRVLAFP